VVLLSQRGIKQAKDRQAKTREEKEKITSRGPQKGLNKTKVVLHLSTQVGKQNPGWGAVSRNGARGDTME